MASRFLAPFTGGRSLFGRDPFVDLHREMNRLFDDASRAFGGGRGGAMIAAPRMDVHELENALEISAELPGVTENDIDLRLDGDVLTLRGEKRQERQDEQAHMVERSYGSFQRSVQLPFAPDPDEVQANFENGVLKIRLPRRVPQETSRRIAIGTGQTASGQSAIDTSGGQPAARSTTEAGTGQDELTTGNEAPAHAAT
jgi:HSP20 family protein